jgi:hypothetical protein
MAEILILAGAGLALLVWLALRPGRRGTRFDPRGKPAVELTVGAVRTFDVDTYSVAAGEGGVTGTFAIMIYAGPSPLWIGDVERHVHVTLKINADPMEPIEDGAIGGGALVGDLVEIRLAIPPEQARDIAGELRRGVPQSLRVEGHATSETAFRVSRLILHDSV